MTTTITIDNQLYAVWKPEIEIISKVNNYVKIKIGDNIFEKITIFNFIKKYSPDQIGDSINIECEECNGSGSHVPPESVAPFIDNYLVGGVLFCENCINGKQPKPILSIELKQRKDLLDIMNEFDIIHNFSLDNNQWYLLGKL